MKLFHRSIPDYLRQPWKNGGGVTEELAIAVHDGAWLWRLSLAEVNASGSFSNFAGYRRTIMVVSGRGMVLEFDQAPDARIDAPYHPHTFEGDWNTRCRLIDGPVKDLNLIWDREQADTRLEVLSLTPIDTVRALSGSSAIIYGLTGSAEIDVSGQRVTLKQADTLQIDDADGVAMCIIRAQQCKVTVIEIDT